MTYSLLCKQRQIFNLLKKKKKIHPAHLYYLESHLFTFQQEMIMQGWLGQLVKMEMVTHKDDSVG